MVIFAKFVAFFAGYHLLSVLCYLNCGGTEGVLITVLTFFSSRYAQSVVPYLEFLPFVLLVVIMFNKSFPLNAVAF